MENSATSRICTREEATSFHNDSSSSCSWTSSMDDLIMFDTTTTTSDNHYNHVFSFSSFENNYCSSEVDNDLEDTATSSPHPPILKMGRLSTKQKQNNQRETIITQAKDKGKRSECGEVEDRIEVGFIGRDNKNCSTGLKHIGLCLVPVSMAVNYFG